MAESPPKIPTAEEILTDPKYGEQKGFFKKIMTGIAIEIQEEEKLKNPKRKDDANFFDIFFGGLK